MNDPRTPVVSLPEQSRSSRSLAAIMEKLARKPEDVVIVRYRDILLCALGTGSKTDISVLDEQQMNKAGWYRRHERDCSVHSPDRTTPDRPRDSCPTPDRPRDLQNIGSESGLRPLERAPYYSITVPLVLDAFGSVQNIISTITAMAPWCHCRLPMMPSFVQHHISSGFGTDRVSVTIHGWHCSSCAMALPGSDEVIAEWNQEQTIIAPVSEDESEYPNHTWRNSHVYAALEWCSDRPILAFINAVLPPGDTQEARPHHIAPTSSATALTICDNDEPECTCASLINGHEHGCPYAGQSH